MKLKFIAVLAFSFFLFSCGSKKSVGTSAKNETTKATGGNETVYESLGNDQANISLQFLKNNTFKFKMKMFAIEDDKDSKEQVIDTKGTYTSDGTWKTLKFKDPKFSLAAIFDSKYATSDAFKLIDKETVKINTAQTAIPIWGVLCEKK